MFYDVPLFRRLDANRSGRLEDSDLAGAYTAYFQGVISAREMDAVWGMWFTGGRFQPRLVTPHPGDARPTLEARSAVRAPVVDLAAHPNPPDTGGYRFSM